MTTFIRYFERIGRHNDCKLHNFNKTALAVNNTHRTKPASDPHLHTLRHINHFCSAELPTQRLVELQLRDRLCIRTRVGHQLSCSASAVRFAVWSNSSSGIASTASGPISCCAFASTGGERAGAITGAVVGSPKCASICRTVTGSVIKPTRRTRPPHPLHLSANTP